MLRLCTVCYVGRYKSFARDVVEKKLLQGTLNVFAENMPSCASVLFLSSYVRYKLAYNVRKCAVLIKRSSLKLKKRCYRSVLLFVSLDVMKLCSTYTR